MKKILLSLVIMAGILAACGQQQVVRKPSNVNENLESPSLSNMANEESFDFVKNILKDKLGSDNDMAGANVDKFMDMVNDYNKSVGEENLIGDFKEDLNPTYDTGKLIENRAKAQKKFPDTNCRINAYLLAVANMKVQRAGNPDDEMLFMDLEKIKEGHLFDDQVSETFRKFFSRVPTNESKNPRRPGQGYGKIF